MLHKATEGHNLVSDSSLAKDDQKVQQFNSLKHIALGSARLLYGNERNKFYDIVPGCDESGKMTVMLACSQDGSCKFLRKEVNACANSATRAFVDGLINDTGLLFGKFDVGDQIRGQQGYRGKDGKFGLDTTLKAAVKDEGAKGLDDTKSLKGFFSNTPTAPSGRPGGVYPNTPTGPSGRPGGIFPNTPTGPSAKRARMEHGGDSRRGGTRFQLGGARAQPGGTPVHLGGGVRPEPEGGLPWGPDVDLAASQMDVDEKVFKNDDLMG